VSHTATTASNSPRNDREEALEQLSADLDARSANLAARELSLEASKCELQDFETSLASRERDLNETEARNRLDIRTIISQLTKRVEEDREIVIHEVVYDTSILHSKFADLKLRLSQEQNASERSRQEAKESQSQIHLLQKEVVNLNMLNAVLSGTSSAYDSVNVPVASDSKEDENSALRNLVAALNEKVHTMESSMRKHDRTLQDLRARGKDAADTIEVLEGMVELNQAGCWEDAVALITLDYVIKSTLCDYFEAEANQIRLSNGEFNALRMELAAKEASNNLLELKLNASESSRAAELAALEEKFVRLTSGDSSLTQYSPTNDDDLLEVLSELSEDDLHAETVEEKSVAPKLTDELNAARRMQELLEVDLDSTRRSLSDALDRVTELEEENEQLQDENKSSELTIRDLERSNQTLNYDLENLLVELDSVKEHRRLALDEIGAYRERVKNLCDEESLANDVVSSVVQEMVHVVQERHLREVAQYFDLDSPLEAVRDSPSSIEALFDSNISSGVSAIIEDLILRTEISTLTELSSSLSSRTMELEQQVGILRAMEQNVLLAFSEIEKLESLPLADLRSLVLVHAEALTSAGAIERIPVVSGDAIDFTWSNISRLVIDGNAFLSQGEQSLASFLRLLFAELAFSYIRIFDSYKRMDASNSKYVSLIPEMEKLSRENESLKLDCEAKQQQIAEMQRQGEEAAARLEEKSGDWE
ncbi:hypothetical protein HOL82_03165, partial [Candidatus Woesearchaeota archaeon]|nr:hypothetical protein [Candidatus Woesearchaeota archaeon]